MIMLTKTSKFVVYIAILRSQRETNLTRIDRLFAFGVCESIENDEVLF